MLCFTGFFPTLAHPANHLSNAIESLRIVVGEASGYVADINGDHKTGLAEDIFELQLASGNLILLVATPVLCMTLPTSWDEDWFASPAVITEIYKHQLCIYPAQFPEKVARIPFFLVH